MNITPDHWLEGVRRETLPGGSAMLTRRFLVMHFTDGATAASSVSWWRDPQAKGASAHVVIDRDGTIIQCRPFNRTCGHAGKSEWRGFAGLNSCSIGIELANGGCDEPGPDGFDWAKKQPASRFILAKHKHEGLLREWEAYPEAQLASARAAARAVKIRYNLDDCIGHEDIAKGRKTDPGPAFPMDQFRRELGFPGPLT
jgi:N-acetylmuramoyl-L-alanine amidase